MNGTVIRNPMMWVITIPSWAGAPP